MGVSGQAVNTTLEELEQNGVNIIFCIMLFLAFGVGCLIGHFCLERFRS